MVRDGIGYNALATLYGYHGYVTNLDIDPIPDSEKQIGASYQWKVKDETSDLIYHDTNVDLKPNARQWQ